jgi:hypothetical protein
VDTVDYRVVTVRVGTPNGAAGIVSKTTMVGAF